MGMPAEDRFDDMIDVTTKDSGHRTARRIKRFYEKKADHTSIDDVMKQIETPRKGIFSQIYQYLCSW